MQTILAASSFFTEARASCASFLPSTSARRRLRASSEPRNQPSFGAGGSAGSAGTFWFGSSEEGSGGADDEEEEAVAAEESDRQMELCFLGEH